ncbi:mechanosensitive ion channel family protein [Marinicauda salina]|uniref:Mechanosensitive ion channel family protein n=1 Tax=Marinicauda salina TaxID=2135793 RepID=A0A2U2BUX1_9PROT|nr:mechanosensitive ion channel family protein [Marinicauda salina]PWE17802.1 mechanosensitive ion channel family protein [Marinicauda salina]
MQTQTSGQPAETPAEDAPPRDADIGDTVDTVWDRAAASWSAASDWVLANRAEALIALATAAGLFVILLAARFVAVRAIRRFAKGDSNTLPAIIARAIAKIGSAFLLLVAVFATALIFPVPDAIRGVLSGLMLVFGVIQTAAVVQEIAVSLLRRKAARAARDGSSLDSAVAVLRWLISAAIWLVALLVILDTAGIQVTALIAGLGVGGIAIGLAAQGIFSDLFASLSILFDKPFKKGDFVVFGTISGTIEEIGLRTTRIRSLSGEQVSLSNTKLIGETIHNYQRLSERRHLMTVGVLYQTPADKLEAIPDWIREDLDPIEDVRVDRVHFAGFGESSLNFEIVFWVTAADYPTFMDKRQAANLAIVKRFEAEGVGFAYPSRTLFFAEPSGEAVDPRGIGGGAPA